MQLLSIHFVTSGGIFDLDEAKKEILQLEKTMSDQNFWQDPGKAQKTVKRLKTVKGFLDPWKEISSRVSDLEELASLADEDDQSTLEELLSESEKINEDLKRIEVAHLLSGPNDEKNAILTIHPGAGGTESADWAQMLMRMYLHWAERRGYKTRVTDLLEGEEAGIKSATIIIAGEKAYGYLKAENGIHRLVRISPFDSNSRRHTSFASAFAIPEVDDDIEIEIREEDLRVDTFRASGAGGQHVNKTSSAIRITHIPTNIVVSCQDERSQHKNRSTAMRILKARLYALETQKKDAERAKIESEKKDIAWGNQVRSYVLQPYTMVRDHRTNLKIGNVQRVLDGDIDAFITEYLRKSKGGSVQLAEKDSEDE